MVKVGSISLRGSGHPLPRERARAKLTLKSIAAMLGVQGTYFVRVKKEYYGGYYNPLNERIIVVEQCGSRKIPMYIVAFRFFHELTHHLHREGGIFNAYYCTEAKLGNGTTKEYSRADRRRVALRAERHAHQKACELIYEFFGLELETPTYPKEYLQEVRKDIFD